MNELTEKTVVDNPESQKDNQKNTAIDKLHTSESQRVFLEKSITGVNRDKRIEAALLFVSGVMTSTKAISERMEVVKHTVIRWKKKDQWAKLSLHTSQITRASLVDSASSYRTKMVRSLEDDLALIDTLKWKTKAKSLEGLLRAKAALQAELTKLLGMGVVEETKVQIVFEGYGEMPGPRGAVRIPGRMATAEDKGRSLGDSEEEDNTALSEGEKEGKGGLIEIPVSEVDLNANGGSGEKGETKVSERVKARGGKKLSGVGTVTREGLTLEEAMQ